MRGEGGAPDRSPCSAVIAETPGDADVADLLERAGLWAAIAEQKADFPRIVILVELGAAVDESVAEARAVERFIDILLAGGSGEVVVAASADSSSLWAGNRDVHALAELEGYRYLTDAGHDYDIVDLGAGIRNDVFPEGSALAGTPASAAWLDADARIVFAPVRADPAEGFLAGLKALLGALPLANKTFHYGQRRDRGDVVAALLSTMPPHFTVLDGRRGFGGAGFLIASRSLVLADIAAGLKLGLDPLASDLVSKVVASHPLPPRYRFEGGLEAIEGAPCVSPLRRRVARAQAADATVETLSEAWLRPLDDALFPRTQALDARVHALIGSLGGADAAGANLAVQMLVAAASEALRDWRVMVDKDALVRRTVPLGVDPLAFSTEDFALMVDELESLAPIARAGPARGPHLRWRKLGGSVVFAYERRVAIPFETFVARVEVEKAIQYMNDYIGGVIAPVAWDDDGRPVRQLERNLYLPQPNYLVLYGGAPIDVTKIEVAERSTERHRLYWKTLFSTNGSASADDGVVTFARDGDGTVVSIVGRQGFTLPAFWRLFDISLIPALDTALTTHAYTTFFDRTLANFEALTEGRDIAIGRAVEEMGPSPSAEIEASVKRIAEAVEPWLDRFRPSRPSRQLGTDGFTHVRPGP